MKAFEHDVLCSICRQNLQGCTEGVADHPVYKLGELAYIELAHRSCAIDWNRSSLSEWRWVYD